VTALLVGTEKTKQYYSPQLPFVLPSTALDATPPYPVEDCQAGFLYARFTSSWDSVLYSSLSPDREMGEPLTLISILVTELIGEAKIGEVLGALRWDESQVKNESWGQIR